MPVNTTIDPGLFPIIALTAHLESLDTGGLDVPTEISLVSTTLTAFPTNFSPLFLHPGASSDVAPGFHVMAGLGFTSNIQASAPGVTPTDIQVPATTTGPTRTEGRPAPFPIAIAATSQSLVQSEIPGDVANPRTTASVTSGQLSDEGAPPSTIATAETGQTTSNGSGEPTSDNSGATSQNDPANTASDIVMVAGQTLTLNAQSQYIVGSKTLTSGVGVTIASGLTATLTTDDLGSSVVLAVGKAYSIPASAVYTIKTASPVSATATTPAATEVVMGSTTYPLAVEASSSARDGVASAIMSGLGMSVSGGSVTLSPTGVSGASAGSTDVSSSIPRSSSRTSTVSSTLVATTSATDGYASSAKQTATASQKGEASSGKLQPSAAALLAFLAFALAL